MDRNTLLAVILSTVVLAIGFYVQGVVFAPETPVVEESIGESAEVADAVENEEVVSETSETPSLDDSYDFSEQSFQAVYDADSAPIAREIVYEDADFLRVVMNTKGGSISQVYLLTHEDNGEPLSLFFGGGSEQGLNMLLGDENGELFDPVYYFRQGETENEFEFYQTVVISGHEDQPFELVKRYTFVPGEYLITLDIEFRNTVNDFIPLNFEGAGYTLRIGPQISPEFTEMPRNSRLDFRKFSYYDGKKRQDIRNLADGESEELDVLSPWAAINGKYFVAVAIPRNSSPDIVFSTDPTELGVQGNQLNLVRPRLESSRVNDSYQFYFGPKSSPLLRMYDNADDNALGIHDLNLDSLMESSWLGWLERALKWVLDFFYGLIPNWGVAIILLTIGVKVLLYPLTRKSYESTAKMREIGPKVNQLREKYGEDAQKLNEKTMELYKKEGVNPLGGCLPMLLQFPFFIAMYSLFNNHFDLRGAVFIPGWITDLSSPEAIVNLPFTIPLVNWDAIRLLPVLFLGTQLVSMKLTQPADTTQNNSQMKMMTYGMPIMFFFIMYNMPSGLLVYWIFQNIITTGQQLYYNYFTHKKVMAGKA